MPPLPETFNELAIELETLGEPTVREKQASSHWGNNVKHKNWVDEWLRQKADERALLRHNELLAEIKRPHWSVIPGFWVGFVAMIAACVAAYPVLWPPQEKKHNAPIQPSQSRFDHPEPHTAPTIEPPKQSLKK